MKRIILALGALLALALLTAPALAAPPLHQVTFSGHGTTLGDTPYDLEYVVDADVAFAGSVKLYADGTCRGNGVFKTSWEAYSLDIRHCSIHEFDEFSPNTQSVYLSGMARANRAGVETTVPFRLQLFQKPDGFQAYVFSRPMDPDFVEGGLEPTFYYNGYGMDAFNGGSLRIT